VLNKKGKSIQLFLFLIIGFVFSLKIAIAQAPVDSSNTNTYINTSVYAEAYYAVDARENKIYNRSNFLYNHTSTRTFSTNIFFVKLNLEKKYWRFSFSPMFGTYANANLSNERRFVKNIFEANVGLKISKKKNIWLDAGVLPSHIGFESAIGADNLTLTRSIAAENSPYFESGIRLSYTSTNQKIYFAFLLLNGWQKIYPINFEFEPAAGIQLLYSFSKTSSINLSNILVQGKNAGFLYYRFFNNVYYKKQLLNKFEFIAGLDYGIQENAFTKTIDHWFSPQIVVAFKPSANLNFALRLENYTDKNNAVILPLLPSQVQVNLNGVSINADYKLKENFFFRLEAKKLYNSQDIFGELNSLKKDNLMFTFSVCYKN
jgi:hypothetical protein